VAKLDFAVVPEAKEPDPFILWLAYALGQAQRVLNIPRSLLSRAFERGRVRLGFNYFYVSGWLALLAVSVAVASRVGASSTWRVGLAAFACWRLAEILVWYLKMLVDRGHTYFVSAERNLVFLTMNGVEAVLAGAVLLLVDAGESPSAIDTFIASLGVFTLNGSPSQGTGGWVEAATIVETATGLLLVGAGLAIIVGLIGEKFKQKGGELTGPQYPPRPPCPAWIAQAWSLVRGRR
jgi:hypothetical protein